MYTQRKYNVLYYMYIRRKYSKYMKRKAVNFRLPYELIFEMAEASKAQGTTVTELLIRYCEQGLQSDATTSVNTDNSDVFTSVNTSEFESAIATAIAPLQQQIDALKSEVGEFAA